jgi:hypothetical protein
MEVLEALISCGPEARGHTGVALHRPGSDNSVSRPRYNIAKARISAASRLKNGRRKSDKILLFSVS